MDKKKKFICETIKYVKVFFTFFLIRYSINRFFLFETLVTDLVFSNLFSPWFNIMFYIRTYKIKVYVFFYLRVMLFKPVTFILRTRWSTTPITGVFKGKVALNNQSNKYMFCNHTPVRRSLFNLKI